MRLSLAASLSILVIGLTATASPASAQNARVCKDGTTSTATGRGACAGNGGVDSKATKALSAPAKVACSDGSMSKPGRRACSRHGGVKGSVAPVMAPVPAVVAKPSSAVPARIPAAGAKHAVVAKLVPTAVPTVVNGQIARHAPASATRGSLLVIPPRPPTPMRMPARPSGTRAARLTRTQIAKVLSGAGVTPPASGLSGTFTLTASRPVAAGGHLDLAMASSYTGTEHNFAVIPRGGVGMVSVLGDGTHTIYFVDCRVEEPAGTAPIEIWINYFPYGVLALTNNHASVVLTLVNASSSSHVDLSSTVMLLLDGCDITPIQ